jgi:hypothetical protein
VASDVNDPLRRGNVQLKAVPVAQIALDGQALESPGYGLSRLYIPVYLL